MKQWIFIVCVSMGVVYAAQDEDFLFGDDFLLSPNENNSTTLTFQPPLPLSPRQEQGSTQLPEKIVSNASTSSSSSSLLKTPETPEVTRGSSVNSYSFSQLTLEQKMLSFLTMQHEQIHNLKDTVFEMQRTTVYMWNYITQLNQTVLTLKEEFDKLFQRTPQEEDFLPSNFVTMESLQQEGTEALEKHMNKLWGYCSNDTKAFVLRSIETEIQKLPTKKKSSIRHTINYFLENNVASRGDAMDFLKEIYKKIYDIGDRSHKKIPKNTLLATILQKLECHPQKILNYMTENNGKMSKNWNLYKVLLTKKSDSSSLGKRPSSTAKTTPSDELVESLSSSSILTRDSSQPKKRPRTERNTEKTMKS